MDLVESRPNDHARFAAWVAEKAEADHVAGRPAPRPLGKALCEERLEGWRTLHRMMASHIYNKVRAALEAQDNEALD